MTRPTPSSPNVGSQTTTIPQAFDCDDPRELALAVEKAFCCVEFDLADELRALLNDWPRWPSQAVRMNGTRRNPFFETLLSAAIHKAGNDLSRARDHHAPQDPPPLPPNLCARLLVKRWDPLLEPREHPQSDSDARTLLMMAAGFDLPELVALLAPKTDLEARDKRGQTAIYSALSHPSGHTLQAFLDAGANPNAVGANGQTLLMKAASRYWPRDVRMLLPFCDLDQVDNDGRNALSHAVCSGSDENTDILAPVSNQFTKARFDAHTFVGSADDGQPSLLSALDCAVLLARSRPDDFNMAWPTFDALAFHASPENRKKMVQDAEATPKTAPRAFARMEADQLAAAVAEDRASMPAPDGIAFGRLKRL